MRLTAPHRRAACWLAALASTIALGCGGQAQGVVEPEGPGATTPSGSVRLASGLTAHYEYHHDRNALRDSRSAGEALIALTRAGVLLRFDAKEVKPTAEWFGPIAATCLGSGEGDAVLAGFADGRITRVDPATLALTPVARVDGAIRWVGWAPGGLVAVAEPTLMKKWNDGIERPTQHSVVHDLASGKSYKLTRTERDPESGKEETFDRRASAFLLDRQRRLWVGGDQGEWGGWCARVDLGAGSVAEVAGIQDDPSDPSVGWDGVYGFAELPDGQVWAYGGTMHMGFNHGFVRRVDGPKAEALYRFGTEDARKGHENDRKIPDLGRPYLPINHILPDRDGKLLVLSYSRTFCVDPALKGWEPGPTLRIHYRAGRPDAVGSYPSVVAVHRLGDRLVCATAVDGYVELVGDQATPHALPGQFGLDQTRRIVGSAEGTLFLPWDAQQPTWRLSPEGWTAAPLAPPCVPEPGEPQVEGTKPAWYETRVMVGPGGTIYTASSVNWTPGTRTTARHVGDQWEVLGHEASALNVAACFVTPDGTLWNAGFGKLLRSANGAWVEVANLPGGEPGGPRVEPRGENAFQIVDKSLQVGYGLRALGNVGPPWLLWDDDHSQLLRLTHGPNFQNPGLDAVPIVEGKAALKILDAIAWSPGELLLATDKGLRRFDIATHKVRPAGLPTPDRPITALSRDGLGRVWLGGEGLWLVDGDGTRLHDLGELPMIGRTAVGAITADPGPRDGVLVALGQRGVVAVRVAPGPGSK